MTGRTGIYLANSLQNKLRQFFIANPDEELTYADICLKFDCDKEAARNAVRELKVRDGGKLGIETAHIVRCVKVLP